MCGGRRCVGGIIKYIDRGSDNDVALRQPRLQHVQRLAVPFTVSPRAMADMLLHLGWLGGTLFRYFAKPGIPTYENMPAEHRREITHGGAASPLMRSDSLSWDDIRTLRFITGQNTPVYAAGVTHRGVNKDGPGEINVHIAIDGMVIEPGDLILGDLDRMLNVPFEAAETVLSAANAKGPPRTGESPPSGPAPVIAPGLTPPLLG